MNAKRKAPRLEETGSDELTEQENFELSAQPEPDAGPDDYDPAKPLLRPGQAAPGVLADDALDREYRRTQGRSFAGEAINASGELGEVVPNATGKPAVEAPENGLIAGAGDPQNGVLTPAGKSPIAWADVSRDVAQHYPLAETGPMGSAPSSTNP